MLLLNSNLNNVSAVQPFVEKATQNIDINQDTFGNILVSLTEAVNNAIRHGNCCEEGKKVKVDIKQKKNDLTLLVSDEGIGFDYNNLPDPLAPENIEKDGGRGIFLMRALSDDISFMNNGSTIEMKFRL
jgi:serine/threonine-protein kinase RsbW